MGAGYFLLTKSGNQFKFTLNAGNHETILNSELYAAKSSAQNGIASVKANSSNDGSYERKTSKDDKAYFVLKAVNGEVIGTERAVLVDLCSSEGHRILQGQRARPNQGRDLGKV